MAGKPIVWGARSLPGIFVNRGVGFRAQGVLLASMPPSAAAARALLGDFEIGLGNRPAKEDP